MVIKVSTFVTKDMVKYEHDQHSPTLSLGQLSSSSPGQPALPYLWNSRPWSDSAAVSGLAVTTGLAAMTGARRAMPKATGERCIVGDGALI